MSARITEERGLDSLDFEKGGGTVTVIAQDASSRAVLMVAHADRAALARTLETGELHLLSRSRGPWRKGATSGNVLRVIELHGDCDGDSVLALVEAKGPACHTGTTSCFATVSQEAVTILERLDQTIESRSRAGDAVNSYTRRLLNDRNLRLKKLGEEASELAVACADGDRRRAVEESADVIYHLLVALRALDAGLADVRSVLEEREGERDRGK